MLLATPVDSDTLSRMARKLRVEYPGAVYRVMNLGDRRKSIFQDNQDRRKFLETLGEAWAKTGWELHVLCLMRELMGGEHYGAERGKTTLGKAERIIAVELKRRRWAEVHLQKRPKGNAAKVKLSQGSRAGTVQTVAWIAQRLHLASRAYANHLLWPLTQEQSSQ